MKSATRLFFAFLLTLSSAAHGAVESTTIVKWSSFSFSTTTGLTLSFAEPYADIFGFGLGDFSNVRANVATVTTEAPSSVGLFSQQFGFSTSAEASTEATDLPDSMTGPTGLINANTSASSPTVGTILDNSESEIFRILRVTAAGAAGTATFTVDYEFHHTVTMDSGVAARATSSLTLGEIEESDNFTAFDAMGVGSSLITFPSAGMDRVEDRMGSLEYSIAVGDGDVFDIGIEATSEVLNNSVIPIPASLPLLASALVAIGIIRRRRGD